MSLHGKKKKAKRAPKEQYIFGTSVEACQPYWLCPAVPLCVVEPERLTVALPGDATVLPQCPLLICCLLEAALTISLNMSLSFAVWREKQDGICRKGHGHIRAGEIKCAIRRFFLYFRFSKMLLCMVVSFYLWMLDNWG